MEKINKRDITEELKESYLDYAMSVIVSRALPDVRDGLKPVHRRILWSMWDSGLTHLAKFRKSANVVGETMARYHPHGDAAIYDSLVRMVQDFSMRYPLVEGQGNFGSIDGDAAAAMRYSEVKLARIAEELLTDIEKETVDWQPNYDGTRLEPKVLPAKLPQLLLNGSLGIAVGMTTNIPPHNLSEVVDAILFLADNPNAEDIELMEFVKGPDFPTGGIIYDKKAILAAYKSGRGKITVRGKAEVLERKGSRGLSRLSETARAGGFDIVITEIPYQVNKAEFIARVAELVETKKIDGIRDIRDESDKEGLRITVELKNEASPQKVLNQLYEHTDLQKDFYVNMLALVDGLQPQILSLRSILVEYIKYRKEVIRRRAEFDLKRAKERMHILEGLSKALSFIDKVIAVIKKSRDRDDAHKNLIKQFKFTELQAAAILEMKLQTLASLEREKIDGELKEKRLLIKDLELTLRSPSRIVKILKDEVLELKTKYGDERRTKVVPEGLSEFKEEDLIPDEKTIITLSKGGYVKRVPPSSFKAQNRGGKGLIGSDVGEEDFLTHFLFVGTHDTLLFFTDRGRIFKAKAYEIPAATRTSKGKTIHNFLELKGDETVTAIVNYREGAREKEDMGKIREAKDRNSSAYLVMATEEGMIKKTPLDDFTNIRRTGIMAISLNKGDTLKWAGISFGNGEIILTTRNGQSIRFKESQVRPMGRSAAGVRAIRLKKEDRVAGFDIIGKGTAGVGASNLRLLIVMENGFAKQTPLKEYKVQNRGGSGIRAVKVSKKTGAVIAAKVIEAETEIFTLSAKGQVLRTSLSSVRTTGRTAQGVRVMNLSGGDRVAGTIII